MDREEALKIVRENYPHFGTTEPWLDLEKALATLIPELRESEDERIRKLLVWQVHRNIEDETNDLAQSVYDGIKGHDPDIEESIEDWKRCLAYLEKHKEQKPAWSEEDEKIIDEACCVIDKYANSIQTLHHRRSLELFNLCEKLKSLRPSWKPSEEQMNLLLNIEGKLRADGKLVKATQLAELYEQLKKLP